MRGVGEKYKDLAKAFADDFVGNRNFTSDELSKWADDHGYPRDRGEEVRADHARRIIRYLRMSATQDHMKERAFRIINRGWMVWAKEVITTDILVRLQHETCQKMRNAANNGQRLNAKSSEVLLSRELSPKEHYVVTISPKIYGLLIGTLQNIEALLGTLAVTIEDHQDNLLEGH
jgi:hypothetical protein